MGAKNCVFNSIRRGSQCRMQGISKAVRLLHLVLLSLPRCAPSNASLEAVLRSFQCFFGSGAALLPMLLWVRLQCFALQAHPKKHWKERSTAPKEALEGAQHRFQRSIGRSAARKT